MGVPSDTAGLGPAWTLSASSGGSALLQNVSFSGVAANATNASLSFILQVTDNSSVVVTGSKVSSGVVITGVITQSAELNITGLQFVNATKSAIGVAGDMTSTLRISDSVVSNAWCYIPVTTLVKVVGSAKMQMKNVTFDGNMRDSTCSKFTILESFGQAKVEIANSRILQWDGHGFLANEMSQISIDGSEFNGFKGRSEGRVASANPASSLLVTNSTFEAADGQVYLFGSSNLTMRNVIFKNWVYSRSFTGIAVIQATVNTTAFIQNVTFVATNRLSLTTSFMSVSDTATFVIDGLTMTGYDCINPGHGSCFQVLNNGKFALLNSEVRDMSAPVAIFVILRSSMDRGRYADMWVDSTIFADNIASIAVVWPGTMKMWNTTVQGADVSQGYYPHLITYGSDASIGIYSCSFHVEADNYTPDSGAVLGEPITDLTVEDTVFARNHADGNGGVFQFDLSASSVSMRNVTFIDNTANIGGTRVIAKPGSYMLEISHPSEGMSSIVLDKILLPLNIIMPIPKNGPSRGGKRSARMSTGLDPSYEGFDCSIKKGVNDSMALKFSADQYPYTLATRDSIYSNLSVAHAPYQVIFRSFDLLGSGGQNVNASLLRRGSSSDATLVFTYSLMDVETSKFLTSSQLSDVASNTNFSQYLSTVTPAVSIETGDIDNVRITEAGPIIVTFISIGVMVLKRDAKVVGATSLELHVLLGTGIAFLYAFPLADVVQPTVASCRTQVVLVPLHLGLIIPTLLVKGFDYYAKRKNQKAVAQGISTWVLQRYLGAIALMNLLHWILAIVWLSVAAPVPTQVFIADSQSRYWVCGSNGASGADAKSQVGFIGVLVGLDAALLLVAIWVIRGVREGVPNYRRLIPAFEDKFLLFNTTNLGVLGSVFVGLFLPNFMGGTAQFALRVAIVLVIATGLWATFFGVKVFGLLTGRETNDHEHGADMDFVLKLALGSSKETTYLSIRPSAATLRPWSAAEVDIVPPFIAFRDSETEKVDPEIARTLFKTGVA
ncbi:hypothetical protein HK104_009328 [Borealophlyctis nickersoniae]|nr:hypothetical protein HK104_009328 [Borealophlyctis nickersoniae]